MAANINPQGTVGHVGRAVPLAFVLAAVGVLLVAYAFVRLCQYFHHSGSVYGFVGATLGPRTGVVAGWACSAPTASTPSSLAAAGIFGTAFLDGIGVWANPPAWAPFVLARGRAARRLALTIARRPAAARGMLLIVEGATVLLILVVAASCWSGCSPATRPGRAELHPRVFTVAPGTDPSALFLGVVFGFLSFAGFEAAATLGEEARTRAGTSRARSSARRSSAASTSCSSPRSR